MSLHQDFKAALRAAYQVRREQGLTVSRALHDAVDEVWSALIKPLAVLDPEDREQVERLTSIMRDNGWCGIDDEAPGDMQRVLREFANPKPPKPEEPTGLGAVVEDAVGDRWVRTDEGINVWSNGRDGDPNDGDFTRVRLRPWESIDAVKVLSEGVPADA